MKLKPVFYKKKKKKNRNTTFENDTSFCKCGRRDMLVYTHIVTSQIYVIWCEIHLKLLVFTSII